MKRNIAAILFFSLFFAAPSGSASAQTATPEVLSQKLDQVLEKLDEIKAELEVVKVRATLR